MKKLAASSGVVIYENANKLHVCKVPAQWTTTFLFVTGLLSFILVATGIVHMFGLFDQSAVPEKFGIIVFAIGVFFTIIFWRVMVIKRRANSIPPNELKIICIFDFDSNHLLDNKHNVLSTISDTILIRKMQITSSSPELILKWASGSITIVKGNPFSGGIADLEKTLVLKRIKNK